MARLALVTGGTRGIGEGCSLALKDAGYQVVANFHSGDKAAKRFHEKSGIPVYQWDVADFEACARGVEQVQAEHGPIEVLVNNAGISPDKFMHKMPPETWNAVIGTNLTSCYNMCRNVLPGMRERKFGRIVNIASLSAEHGTYGEVAYAASKGGVVSFTKVLALESARLNITVNAIAPGYIDTDMLAPAPKEWLEERKERTPVHRLGQPDDIGRCVVFLAADQASFITGSVLFVTGGYDLT